MKKSAAFMKDQVEVKVERIKSPLSPSLDLSLSILDELRGLKFSETQHSAGWCGGPIIPDANGTTQLRKVERGSDFRRMAHAQQFAGRLHQDFLRCTVGKSFGHKHFNLVQPELAES